MKINKNVYLSIGSIFIIALSIFLIFSNYKKLDVLNKGKEVKVYIIEVPINCSESTRRFKAYFRFEYKNKTYTKNIKGKKYCETIVPNSTIILKTNKDNSIFVYPDENIKTEIIVTILLFLIGLGCLYKSFRKK